MNDILVILGTIIACILFTWLRPKIFKGAKQTIKEHIGLNASIGNVYKKNGEEAFQVKKFVKGFGGLLSPVGWAKDFIGIFNIRKLTIYILIISIIFAYGYWKGNQNTPIQVNLGWEESVEIQVPNSNLRLYKPKNSNDLYWIDKKGNKIHVNVSDIPALKRKLAPIGLQFEPILIVGAGMGLDGIGGEVGVGVSWLRYWKWRMDAFITNKGLYPLATSYKITPNSGIGFGIGAGWAGDARTILYFASKF